MGMYDGTISTYKEAGVTSQGYPGLKTTESEETMDTHSTTSRKPSGARLNRGDKARLLFETGCVHPAGHGTYRVDSGSGAGQYRVEQFQGSSGYHWECTCQDYRRHALAGDLGWTCKHLSAVHLYRAAVKAAFVPRLAA